MRILTICIGATVRSVALKNAFKFTGHDALAASAIENDPATVRMLCRWADVIIPVEPRSLVGRAGSEPWKEQWHASPIWDAEFDRKRVVCDLGPDVWGTAAHAQLRDNCTKAAQTMNAQWSKVPVAT